MESYEEYLASVRAQESRDRARFTGEQAGTVVYDMRDGSAVDLRTDESSTDLDWAQAVLILQTFGDALRETFDAICEAVQSAAPAIEQLYNVLVAASEAKPPSSKERRTYPKPHGQWWLAR